MIQAPGRPSDPPKEPPRARTASAATANASGLARQYRSPDDPSRLSRDARCGAPHEGARLRARCRQIEHHDSWSEDLRRVHSRWDSQSHENARRTAVRDDAPRDGRGSYYVSEYLSNVGPSKPDTSRGRARRATAAMSPRDNLIGIEFAQYKEGFLEARPRGTLPSKFCRRFFANVAAMVVVGGFWRDGGGEKGGARG